MFGGDMFGGGRFGGYQGQGGPDGGLGGGGRPSVGDGGFLSGGNFSSQDVGGGKMYGAGGSEGERQTLSLTAAMLIKAHSASPTDSRLSVLGCELSHFKLVGYMKQVAPFDGQKIAFTLDDGTADIRVEWYTGFICETMSPYRQQRFDELQENAWVAVYGELNLLGKMEPHVKAMMIRKLTDFNEIFFHTLDVAHTVALKTKPEVLAAAVGTQMSKAAPSTFGTSQPPRSMPPASGGMASGVSGMSSMGAGGMGSGMGWQQAPVAAGGGSGAMWGGGRNGGEMEASRKLLDVLRQLTPARDQGVGIGEMLNRMRAEGFPEYTEVNLRNSLDQLRTEGSAYFSNDQNHWKA